MAKGEYEDQYPNMISQGTNLKGDVVFEEGVMLDGRVEGTITVKGALLVGERAEIKAGISATSVEIRGTVRGSIHCDGLLALAHTAKLSGDIQTVMMSMEEGAIINGKVNMQKSQQTQMLEPVEHSPKEEPEDLLES